MKLLLKQPFTLEVPHEDGTEEVLTGTFSPLTKTQLKEFRKLFKPNQDASDLLRKTQKQLRRLKDKDLTKKYELEDEIEALIKKITNFDTDEETAKERIRLSVESDDMKRIDEIADLLGYNEVFAVILKDIEDKRGNDIPA